jgi:hypothetical protein
MEKYSVADQDKNNEAYEMAYQRVKKIKKFYTHLLVYIFVNVFIIVSTVNRNVTGEEVFLKWETFSTAFFWGIGLLAHAFSTFMPNFIFGEKWEEKKMKEYMEKEKDEISSNL